jgi:hypothetical protein
LQKRGEKIGSYNVEIVVTLVSTYARLNSEIASTIKALLNPMYGNVINFSRSLNNPLRNVATIVYPNTCTNAYVSTYINKIKVLLKLLCDICNNLRFES